MTTASVDADIGRALLRPAMLGNLELPSRVAMAPMSRYKCPDGIPHQGVANYYRRRAENGVGLIITEATYIDHPAAASYEAVPVFHGERALSGWNAVRLAVQSAGARIFPQLWHTGSFRQSWMGPIKGVPGIGPSENHNAFTGHAEQTRAMDQKDVDDVVDAYARAAVDAQRLGFDGIEIHGAHGYLIDEFFWDRTNRRSDRYGGDRRERTRFAVEIIAETRRRVGPDFPISFRFSQWKQQDYKVRLAETPAELGEVLEPLVDAGVSILHASTRRFWEAAFPDDGERTLAGWIRALTGLPVIMVGGAGLDRPGLKEALPASLDVLEGPLLRNEFDVLAVGRALLADAEWFVKVGGGRFEECRPYTKDLLETLD